MTPAALRAMLPRPPRFEYDWSALGALPTLNDWLRRMAATPQNPAWHGEGDVLTHTRAVCAALCRLPAFRALDDAPRDALALAALLHDVGKIRCTRVEGGAYVSPHHAAVGAKMARSWLWREVGLCGTPDAQRLREAVCLLIRGHSAPMHLAEDADGENRALRLAANGELAPDFTLNALCLLAEADARGRIAPDVADLLDAVAFSRELAREARCLDAPRPFAAPRTLRAYFTGARVWPDQALYDDSWGEVTLMCGLPGTGKDTWIREHAPGLPTVSLDDVRARMGVLPTDNQGPVVQAAKASARALLRAKQPFVWNATSLTGLRAGQIELFEAYGARVRIVFLETNWAENLRRNAGRANAVPEDVIGRMLDRLEPPERWEAQRVEWICV